MRVRQFRYATDNLGYLFYTDQSALAVDGGAVDEICEFIDSAGLSLSFVTNTHQHSDHTCGNRELIERTGATFMDNRDLGQGHIIDLDREKIDVYHTPGHTGDSICFRSENVIVTGDTLFNGTIGNCFTDSIEVFYHSIKKLIAMTDSTIVYAGHDYVHSSLVFARHLEPENDAIDLFLGSYDPSHVFSTLEEERAINPYLRFNNPAIITFLRQNNLPVSTEIERWNSLMQIG